MKIFSFISSAIVFAITLYSLITDFPSLKYLNGVIYFMLLIILMLICITGLITNSPFIYRFKRRFKIPQKQY
ncbi:hypothetical protein CHU92_15435 [Flavobacterium cyanobacteriorum]|uniref:Uncharacterized protein n=1 Tax=Flavobacterium cyanobacteriorum TaxID=2022802 RepID=A0A255YT78_9FLAO|nr:hypothetical protein [Flavobacterium cyanobacteriorum]OYQ31884.1 hypothetical protein CHU92_15435 [Flavobacterium cyanobacteriorum]